MPPIKISFVILNYNRENDLLITLSATKKLLHGKSDFEIIVVDNASSDHSVQSVKAFHPDVVVVQRHVNNGVAGWNDGFALARGSYLAVLDDDSNIEDGLDNAIEILDKNPEVGILALNIIGGAFPTDYLINLNDSIDFIGCGAIIRTDVYKKIGGFAEWLFIYTHEWEYAIRCLNAGYKIRYCEDCHVNHRTSSINRTSKRLKVFSIRNEMAIVYKFFDKSTRKKYVARVFLNHLKTLSTDGVKMLPLHISALREFFKIKDTLEYTPVTKEIQDYYTIRNWATRRFYKIV
ncbi:MAG: glycosyltransferase family 2 protein [Janthinobacterium lividum]